MLRKRILPALLAVCMLIALLPSAAFAAENEDSEKVAETAGVQYESLSEAIEAAADNATIKLLTDSTIENYIEIRKPLTLDLGGYTLTSAKSGFDVYANFTLKNGTLNTNTWGVWVQNSGVTFTLDKSAAVNADRDTTLTNAVGVTVVSGAKAEIYGTVTAQHNFAVSGNGSTNSGDVTINVYPGAVITTTSDAPALYFPNSAQLNVTGGTITGGTGIYVKSGRVIISDGTITGNGPKANYEYYGNGANSTGDALVIDKCGYQGGVPQVSITGGKFESVNANAIGSYVGNNETEPLTGFVTGGTFSSDPSAYLAEGKFITAADEVGYYTVTDSDPGAATIVVKDNTNATVPEDVTLDEAYKTAVEKKTNVEGVAEAVENKKAAIAEKAGVNLTDSTKKIEVDVKVNVSVESVERENDAVTAIVFTASPVATVKEDGAEKVTGLDVKDMLDGSEITVTLPVPDGMVPKQIKHTFSDNSGVEYFLASGNGGKTFTYDKETGCVTFRITRFSTFEVSAVQTYTPAAPVSTYRVNVTDSENGVITASHVSAAAGTTVTLTAAPAEGYVLKTLTVTDASGKAVTLTEKDGKYTFTMPASAVTVAAAFEKGAHTDCPAAKFSDVDVTLWYHEALDYVLNAGMMNGVGSTSFAPNGDLNRAMLVTILWRLAGEPSVNCAMPFTDVPDGVWYTEAVRWAFSTGVVNGMTATTFAPMESITRQQLVTMLYRYAQLKEYDTTMGGMAVREYDDFESIADWALAAVDWAANAQLMNGRGNNMLVPEGTATRAEAAKLLMVFCKTIVK